MELTNEIYAQEPLDQGTCAQVRKEIMELLTLMLAPMTPHIAEEMWEMLGHSNGLSTASWPAANAELAREYEVEVPVQVNGKLRGKLKVAAGTKQDDLVTRAKAEPGIAQHLEGKRIIKVVYVPDKLLNLVVA